MLVENDIGKHCPRNKVGRNIVQAAGDEIEAFCADISNALEIFRWSEIEPSIPFTLFNGAWLL